MRLVTFLESAFTRVGILDPQGAYVVDLSAAAPWLPKDLLALIAQGDGVAEQLHRAVASGSGRIPVAKVRLLAPLPRPPRNLFCVGKNYRDHLKEVQSLGSPQAQDDAVPEVPIFFTKATSSVIGPLDAIPAHTDPTHSVDYEGELAVVIGAGGREILRNAAMAHVFGYTIVNDVTSRRLQKAHQQWFIGKSLDGFCPMGPCVVTRDEIPDVGRLRIHTTVNGELRQTGEAAQMIFDIPTLIETLSRYITLESGDIIATGTPAGVGMGFKPPRYLRHGDTVSITIEPIGTLTNPVL